MIPAAIFIVAAVALLTYEFWALSHQRMTISQYVWLANRAFPPLAFLAGLIIGGLAVHFTWPVCF